MKKHLKSLFKLSLVSVLLSACQTTAGPSSPSVISSGAMSRTMTASSIRSLPETVGQVVIYRDGLLAIARSPSLYIDGQSYGSCKHGKYTTVNLRPGTYRLSVGVENVVVDVKDGEQTFVKCGVWRSILDSNNFGFVDVIKREVGSKEANSLGLLMSFDVYQQDINSTQLAQADEQENASTDQTTEILSSPDEIVVSSSGSAGREINLKCSWTNLKNEINVQSLWINTASMRAAADGTSAKLYSDAENYWFTVGDDIAYKYQINRINLAFIMNLKIKYGNVNNTFKGSCKIVKSKAKI